MVETIRAAKSSARSTIGRFPAHGTTMGRQIVEKLFAQMALACFAVVKLFASSVPAASAPCDDFPARILPALVGGKRRRRARLALWSVDGQAVSVLCSDA